ncbi:MAG: branched-chain amino acid ABC transporter permease [Proteobacteria bacterium]|nr:branched-chain amino acid ABC transporter permease [Pseudomonadota bacterium]
MAAQWAVPRESVHVSDLVLGLLLYVVGVLTMAGIYSVLTIGLNIQWGLTGLFNAGIAGFFAIGAYVSTILTSAPSATFIGGFGAPFVVGLLVAAVVTGAVGYFVGRLCIRLRADYLAIATIGIAEIFRLILKNEIWATNGPRGISNIPRPFEDWGQPWSQLAFLGVVALVVLIAYLLSERAGNSPWGRVMRSIRDNEAAAAAVGKNVTGFRLQGFVFGCALMGLGGALAAHFFKFIGPESTEPLMATFLVWVMLIIGGSGNNRGAMLGAVAVWTLWSATELLTSQLPPEWAVRAAFLRVFLIGLGLQIVLQRFSKGLLPERPPKSTITTPRPPGGLHLGQKETPPAE